MILFPLTPLEINFNTLCVAALAKKAHNLSTLKRTKTFAQSDLSDFLYEPGNLFQGGY